MIPYKLPIFKINTRNRLLKTTGKFMANTLTNDWREPYLARESGGKDKSKISLNRLHLTIRK